MSHARRESLEIFEFLNRFGIGDETTNRIDNVLVFGPSDEMLRPYYVNLVESAFSAQALDELSAMRNEYLERPDAIQDGEHPFLASLQAQRRAIFFQIPDDQSEELRLWDLTVFRHAGEFLREVVTPRREALREQRCPSQHSPRISPAKTLSASTAWSCSGISDGDARSSHVRTLPPSNAEGRDPGSREVHGRPGHNADPGRASASER